MNVKACRKCKFCGWNIPPYTRYMSRTTVCCSRIPPELKTDLVTGEVTISWELLCYFERENENGCGPEGKYFELYDGPTMVA